MKTDSIKQQLRKEGFKHIYEWTDRPNAVYNEHHHKDKVKLSIVSGSITFTIDEEEKTLTAGKTLSIPPQTNHSAVVGPNGCTYIVGEMIEGDS